MKEKNKKKGGKRIGSGRKPSGRQKEAVTVYTDVSRFGGKAGARIKIYELLDGEIRKTDKTAFVTLDDVLGIEKVVPADSRKEVDLKFPSKAKKAPQKPIVDELGDSINLHKKTKDEAYDAPPLLKNVKDEFSKAGAVKPKTLDELKKLCPAELTGLDRSEWVRTERQKYGI